MSYRTYVNNYQFLGNDEQSEDLIKELKKQGCKIDSDGCFRNFEIKELDPIIKALERYIIKTDERAKKLLKKGISNFEGEFEVYKKGDSLTFDLQELSENAYLFITVNFLRHIKDDYQIDYKDGEIFYNLKEGHKIYMSAF